MNCSIRLESMIPVIRSNRALAVWVFTPRITPCSSSYSSNSLKKELQQATGTPPAYLVIFKTFFRNHNPISYLLNELNVDSTNISQPYVTKFDSKNIWTLFVVSVLGRRYKCDRSSSLWW